MITDEYFFLLFFKDTEQDIKDILILEMLRKNKLIEYNDYKYLKERLVREINRKKITLFDQQYEKIKNKYGFRNNIKIK